MLATVFLPLYVIKCYTSSIKTDGVIVHVVVAAGVMR